MFEPSELHDLSLYSVFESRFGDRYVRPSVTLGSADIQGDGFTIKVKSLNEIGEVQGSETARTEAIFLNSCQNTWNTLYHRELHNL